MVSIDPQFAIWLAVLLGLAVGNCLNTVVHRLPGIFDHEPDTAGPEDRVAPLRPAGQSGRWRPGWRILRGWAPMAGRYPAIELTTAGLFALCVWRFGPGLPALCAMVLVGALVTLAWIDARTCLLPDLITLPLTWAGLLVNTMQMYASPVEAILGAALGYLFLWGLFHVFRWVTGREGMGYGDFKLLAALGAWLGVNALPLILLVAALAGVVVGMVLILTGRMKRNQPQPFGPYLALAGIVGLLMVGVPVG